LIIILRIIEKLLIIYYSAYFIIDLTLFFYSLRSFRKLKNKSDSTEYDYSRHSISIIVPAYNEEVSIVNCVKMLMEVDYDDFEVIVINDGSTDRTFDKIIHEFEFKLVEKKEENPVKTAKIKHIYHDKGNNLLLIDKMNGGKADSINAGINYSTKKYICTIDADSILDNQALKRVINPMITDKRVFVSGGNLAASNDVVIKHNNVVSSRMPRNIWVLWQIIEYIKSFMVSRIGLSRINSLLIMSGAFSLYKKNDLMSVGGFLTKINDHPYIIKTLCKGKSTVTEDMEIVIRLWRYFRENRIKAKIRFLPDPVCWTEVPDNSKNLFKQRSRWQLGLAETLNMHKKILFEPKYGTTGMIAFPYYTFFELFSPVVKMFTLVFLIFAGIFGLLNQNWVVLLLLSILIVTAVIMGLITVFIENWSQKKTGVNRDALRYKTFKDWLWLVLISILGDISYSFFKLFAQLSGLISFLRKKSEWNKFERKGVATE
jgi:cellulose synthase/poly-beta-1,6-N-acetylglucosamine synthase-like glycosyltransferase